MSLIEELGAFVPQLRPGGSGNYLGYCPLHGEQPGRSTPSFSIHGETGLWLCFAGCGAGNLDLLLRRLNQTTDEAAEFLRRVGPLGIREEKRFDRAFDPLRTPYPLPEAMLGLWDYRPDPLIAEGFSEEVLRAHDIGVDLISQRITFPIRDASGQLAGVSGRDYTGQSPARYKVYAVEIQRQPGFSDYSFSSRDHLWRADRVYPLHMRSRNTRTIVVEGYKAALWLVQHGYPNVVALQGSRPTDNQITVLARMGGQILVMLDNDRAGLEGSRVMCQKLYGMQTRVVAYPESFHQPSDIPAWELKNILPS